MMKNSPYFSKLRVESLEERTLLAVMAGVIEHAAELAAPTEATTWIVNTWDDPTSWDLTDDTLSLREAIARAEFGDRISFESYLAGDTIYLNGNQLEVSKGLTIDASDIGGITINADGKSRVFYVNSRNPVGLIGLTITGGQTNNSGGGIYNDASTLQIINCTVTNNSADYGGGIYNDISSYSFTFTPYNLHKDNSILLEPSTLILENSNISMNIANNDGGGVFNKIGYYREEEQWFFYMNKLVMTNCNLTGNSANGSGGGIYSATKGDIITSHEDTLTITDSTISNNTAGESGGGIFTYDGILRMFNSIIVGNRAKTAGGGINGSYCVLNSCSIYGNVAYNYNSYGGGFNGTGYLTNCTIAGNSAETKGGVSGGGLITNTIISHNFASVSPDADTDFYGTHNIVGFDPSFKQAPKFDESGNLINLNSLDLSLTGTSFAIDRGTNDVVMTQTDIMGAPRIISAWKTEATVDIGAYEYQNGTNILSQTITVTTELDSNEEADGLISFREAINMAECGDTIVFHSRLAGKTIVLVNGNVEINKSITIDASMIDGISVRFSGESYNITIDLVPDVQYNTVTMIGLRFMGGYISNYNGLIMKNCNISNSTTRGFFNHSLAFMSYCTISDNTGGGIYNNGTLKISNCDIINNSCLDNNFPSSCGGGIYNAGSVEMTDSRVIGNSATYYGGGISSGNYNSMSGSLVMTNCIVSNNTAGNLTNSAWDVRGGGVYSSGYLHFTSCLISQNTALSSYYAYGGGIYSKGNQNYLRNCTITNNVLEGSVGVAVGGGGGLFIISHGSIFDTIIVENTYNDSVEDILDGGNILSATNSLSSYTNWSYSSDCLVYDPTKQLFNNPENGDFTLAKNSQAINAGQNTYYYVDYPRNVYTGENLKDLAGNLRVIDGIIDLGAYEYQPELPTFSVSITDWSGSYDGLAHSITVNDPYADTDTIRYSTDGATYNLTVNPAYTNVGAYTTYVKVSRNGYQDWYGSAIVEIAPAKIKDITLTGWTGNFDNTTHAIIVSDPYASTDTIRYSTDGKTYNLIDNPQYIGVGTYTTYVKVSRTGYQDWYGSAVVKITASVVTTLDDIVDSEDGFISLREAIASASDGDSVSFSESLSGGTISLDGTQLEITKAITIDASGIGGIRIDCNGLNRAFYMTGGTEESPVELIGLTISGGTVTSGNGGGIYNTGALELRRCSVTGNSAGSGGGIYNSGQLTMFDCVVSDNTASSRGGGIFSSGSNSSLMMFGCTVAGNSSTSRGGGIFNSNGEMVLYNTIIALNTARIDADINNPNTDSIIEAYHCLSSFAGWATSLNCLEYDSGLPLFANPVIGDYSLAHNSQAIDRGSNAYVETETDLAGNMRVVNGIVDLGAYECQGTELEQLAAPTITTGNMGIYVSYGANRHQILWDAIDNASGYELAYSADGNSWTTAAAEETSEVITGLAYGAVMEYRVRALGEGSYTDSDWSGTKSFVVCPIDVNNDGDISGADRAFMVDAWLSEEGGDRFVYYADINGDGDITGADRAFLVSNWLLNVEDDAVDFVYPPAKISDAVFAGFASADLAADLDVF